MSGSRNVPLVPLLVTLSLMVAAPVAQAKQEGSLPPAVERGEQLYLENCWHCHGKRGLADGPLTSSGPVPAPPLAGRVPDDSEPWMVAIHRGQGTMPAFAPVMDRTAIRSILTWLEALDPVTGDGPSIEEEERKKAQKKKDEAAAKAKKAEETKSEPTKTTQSPETPEADDEADEAEPSDGPKAAPSSDGDRP